MCVWDGVLFVCVCFGVSGVVFCLCLYALVLGVWSVLCVCHCKVCVFVEFVCVMCV